MDAHERGRVLVSARQLFGLWALGLLLASMFLGPLTSVLSRIPLKGVLLYARRSIGICAFALPVAHAICYLAAICLRSWCELYTPGVLWVVGLLLGGLAIADLTALAATSRDAAVKRMGGRRWKRLHQSVYVVLGVVLLHALFTGAPISVSIAARTCAANRTRVPASHFYACPSCGLRCSFFDVSASAGDRAPPPRDPRARERNPPRLNSW